MASIPPILLGLFEDAGVSDHGDVARAVREYRAHRAGSWGALLGPMLVPDHQLVELGRCAVDEASLPVCVRITSGAGGLLAMARRKVPGVQLVAVESALRDLDELAQNAARVAAAARELDPDVTVYVGVPYAPGWPRAVAVVEEAGLCCSIVGSKGGQAVPPGQLAEQLQGLIEADVAFKITGGGSPVPRLLRAVEALVDGALLEDATAILAGADSRDGVADWHSSTAARVRRRLRLVSSQQLSAAVEDLSRAGLLSPA